MTIEQLQKEIAVGKEYVLTVLGFTDTYIVERLGKLRINLRCKNKDSRITRINTTYSNLLESIVEPID